MKKITLLFAMLFCFASYGQVETNITQNLVSYLNGIPQWNNMTYGCCAGDPSNAEEQNEDLCVGRIYVVDLSLIGVDELFINKRVEMRNGTLKVINGTVVFDDTNGGEFVTYEFGECVSNFVLNENNDLGKVYFSTAEYIEAQEVLSVESITKTLDNNRLPENMQFDLIDILGRTVLQANTDNHSLEAFRRDYEGIYILKFYTDKGNVSVKQIF